MGQGSLFGTRILVRRATPFVAIAAAAVVAVVLIAVAAGVQPAYVAAAILLVAVFAGLALAVVSMRLRARATAAQTRRRLEDLAVAERRLRTTLEAAGVGLALSDVDGRFTQVNPALASILGRDRDHLMRASLADVTATQDRPALVEALGMIRRGDLARWEGQVIQRRPDGTDVPVALSIARLPGAAGEPALLVQATDSTAGRRADALRDCAAAVREVITAAPTLEAAMPELLVAFRENLGWRNAHHWS